MKPELLHILQHALGVDQYGRGRQYRNRFITGPDSDDFLKCQQLTELGLMRDHGAQSLAGGMHCFEVTKQGVSAMLKESPKPPKTTSSQTKYAEFLKADSGLTFIEWLKRNAENKLHRPV